MVEHQERDRYSFDPIVALTEVYNAAEIQLSKEREAQLLMELDFWLLGDPGLTDGQETLQTRTQYLEKHLVVLEKRAMVEQGREGILSPPKKRLLEYLVKSGDPHVLISGAPGTGKSVFLEMFGARLSANHDTNGVVRVNGETGMVSTDLVARTANQEHPLFSTLKKSTVTAIDVEQNPEALRDFLIDALKQMVGNYVRENNTRLYWQTIVKMGLQLPTNPTGSNLKDFIEEVIDANRGAAAVQKKLESYWYNVEQNDLYNNHQLKILGELYSAITLGLTCIIDEADKMTLDRLIQFGHGLESLLEARPGERVHVGGEWLIVKEGFHLVASANEVANKIPENIQRRMHMIEFDSSIEDMVFQARVMLADENGDSILAERPQDEHDLAGFLLWWEAVGRHKKVAFNINALAKICNKLKAGQSFTEALDDVLQGHRELVPVFAEYRNRGHKQFSSDSLDIFNDQSEKRNDEGQLGLAELNWVMCRQYIGSANAVNTSVRSTVNLDTVATANQTLSPAVAVSSEYTGRGAALTVIARPHMRETANTIGERIMEYPLPHVDNEDDRKVVASPLAQTCLLLNDATLTAIDLPTGETLLIQSETHQNGKKHSKEWGEGMHVLHAYWHSEQEGVMVVKNAEQQLLIVTMEKTFIDDAKSEFWVPQLSIIHQIEIPSPSFAINSEIDVQIAHGVIDIRWMRDGQHVGHQLAQYQPSSPSQPILLTRPVEGVVHIAATQLGTFVQTEKGTTWLRAT